MIQNLEEAVQNQDNVIQEGNKGQKQAHAQTLYRHAQTSTLYIHSLYVCRPCGQLVRSTLCRGRHTHLNLAVTWSSAPDSDEDVFISKERARMSLAKIRYPNSTEFL